MGKTNIRKLQEKWKKTIWRVTNQNTRLMVIRQVFGGNEEVFSVQGKPWEKYFLWDENLGWASTNQHLVIIRQGLLGGGQWPCSFIFHVLVVKELNIHNIRTTGVQQVCKNPYWCSLTAAKFDDPSLIEIIWEPDTVPDRRLSDWIELTFIICFWSAAAWKHIFRK